MEKVISEVQDSGRAGASVGSLEDHTSDELSDSDSMLESMVEATGRLEIDEAGAMDFHGHSSSIAFLSHLRSNFQRILGEDITKNIKSIAFPKSMYSPGHLDAPPETSLLPSKEVATILVDSCLDDACALMRFVHRPSFDKSLDRIYDIPGSEWGQQDREFLPLLYEVLAVGYLFADDVENSSMVHAISEGWVQHLSSPVFGFD